MKKAKLPTIQHIFIYLYIKSKQDTEFSKTEFVNNSQSQVVSASVVMYLFPEASTPQSDHYLSLVMFISDRKLIKCTLK